MKAAEARDEVAKAALIELEKERIAKAKRMERAGVNSENRGEGNGLQYLRPDGSTEPDGQRRAK